MPKNMMVNNSSSIKCCCNCRKNNKEFVPKQVTAQLLYKIAFTVWHVAFHIENEQVLKVLPAFWLQRIFR